MPEYAVVRTWQRRHGKRNYQIVVGPYPSRYRAQRTIEEYVNEWGYHDNLDQFSVALYRRPEAMTFPNEVV